MMSWLRVLFVVGALVQLTSPAEACSAPPNCRKLGSVQPSDGATGVPRNIELRITYDGAPDRNASVVLQTDDGRDVPIRWETATTYQGQSSARTVGQLWIGRSATPLEPATHYRLRHAYSDCSASDSGVPPSCDGLCFDAAGEVISEFTTGANVDEVVLAAPAIGPVTSGGIRDGAGDSCGPYLYCVYSIDVPTLPSGQLLRVTRGDGLIGYFGASSGELSAGVVFSGRSYPWGASFFSESGEVGVSVVDAIGNRSPTATFVLPTCVVPDVVDAGLRGPDASAPVDASASVDARTPVDARAPADARTSDAGAAIDAGEDDGCALGRAHSTGALWLALAFMLRRLNQRRQQSA